MAVTDNRQCLNISLINDAVLEDDEIFSIESAQNMLITATQSFIQVTILNDDSTFSS